MDKSDNRIRLLAVLKILVQYSDENHPLSSVDILQYLSEQNILAEKKAIVKDIKALEAAGLDILYTHSPKQGYYLSSRLFENVELGLLVDAIQSSSFISYQKAEELIQKLTSSNSIYDAENFKSTIIKHNKPTNQKLFYSINELQLALQQKRAISFLYFDFDIYKQKIYRKNSKRYSLIPYTTLWNNQRYYCIGYDIKHQSFAHYRIDKMDDIQLEGIALERPSFNYQEYASNNIFDMYQGKQETVLLRVDHSLLNVIYDQFGQDVLINNIQKDTFDLAVSVSISITFISWLFNFGNKIQVLGPLSLIEQIKKTAQEVLSLYENKNEEKDPYQKGGMNY